jgi:uncharacterized membrane protein
MHFPFFIFHIFFLLLLFSAVFLFARNRSRNNINNPRTLLAVRYVNGELTSDEYKEMKEVLKEK